MLRDLFGDVRMLADNAGLMNPVSRRVWRLLRHRRPALALPQRARPGRLSGRPSMSYVVTRSCCADASCVVACPVNCIHPAPGEPGFAEAEMLYIDDKSCVGCGACVTACPVGAIVPDTALRDDQQPFVALAAEYYDVFPHADRTPLAPVPRPAPAGRRGPVPGRRGRRRARRPLRRRRAAHAPRDLGRRLRPAADPARTGPRRCRARPPGHQGRRAPVPGRRGAPAVPLLPQRHGRRGPAARGPARAVRRGRLRRRCGLRPPARHPRRAPAGLGLGDRRWSVGTTATRTTPTSTCRSTGERAVVIGNGNVALDVARILTTDPAVLARTDMAALPWAALSRSRVREVVVLGRRGAEHAAFTTPELVALAGAPTSTSGSRVRSRPGDGERERCCADLAGRRARADRPRIVLRFDSVPVEVLGDGRATGVRLADGTEIAAGLVVRAIGYHGEPVADLPYDAATGTVPHDRGRVAPGRVRRGLGQARADRLHRHQQDLRPGDRRRRCSTTSTRVCCRARSGTLASIESVVRGRCPDVVDLAGWRAIDAEERRRGTPRGRPRAKIVDVDEMLAVVRRTAPRRGGVDTLGRRPETGSVRRPPEEPACRRRPEVRRPSGALGPAQPGPPPGHHRRRDRGARRDRAGRRGARPADRRPGRAQPHRRLPALRRPGRPRRRGPGRRARAAARRAGAGAVLRGHAGRDHPPDRGGVRRLGGRAPGPPRVRAGRPARPGPGSDGAGDRPHRRPGRGPHQRRRPGAARPTWRSTRSRRSTRWSSGSSARCSPPYAAGCPAPSARPTAEQFVAIATEAIWLQIAGMAKARGVELDPDVPVERLLESALDGAE